MVGVMKLICHGDVHGLKAVRIRLLILAKSGNVGVATIRDQARSVSRGLAKGLAVVIALAQRLCKAAWRLFEDFLSTEAILLRPNEQILKI